VTELNENKKLASTLSASAGAGALNKEAENSATTLSATIIRRDNEEYKIVKKLPRRFPTRPNDIYITNKTDFKAQLLKCQHILFERKTNENESNEIFLHAIGPAINRFQL
jgi:hypothetical protein